MVHITDHDEVAGILRNAEKVSDKRPGCTALHVAVAKGKN